MKKRILSLLLAVVMVVSMLPVMALGAFANGAQDWVLYVGEEELTAEHLTNAAGTAVFDPATDTLTLENFVYSGEGVQGFGKFVPAVFYEQEDLKGLNLVLKGQNIITLTGSDSNKVYEPVYVEGALAVSGTGSLTVTVGGQYESAAAFYADEITLPAGVTVWHGDDADSAVELADGEDYADSKYVRIGMRYPIAVEAVANGVLAVDGGRTAALVGDTVTLSAAADEGCELVAITVNGTAIQGNSFVMPAEAVTVGAIFKPFAPSEDNWWADDELFEVACDCCDPGVQAYPYDDAYCTPGNVTWNGNAGAWECLVQIDLSQVLPENHEWAEEYDFAFVVGRYFDQYGEWEMVSDYLTYDAVSVYTVTFVSDGQTLSSETVRHGEKAAAPADPVKTGYTFLGWDKAFDHVTDNLTVKALWTVNQYTITFDTDGGSEVAAITADYGAAVTAPADPTKTGYTFAGWDVAVPATMPAEDMTITAKWTVNQYTITFDTDGGTAVAAITADYGTAVTAPADPVKTGYTFAGWDVAVPATMPAEDMTITAQWTVNQYTITFDTDGGSEVAAITADYGTAVTAPADPVKTGYTFAGWDVEIPATMPAEDMTITAQWTINQYNVTVSAENGFVAVNGSYNPASIDYNAAVKLAVAAQNGYEFESLKVNGVDVTDQVQLLEYTFNMPAEDVSVEATFKPRTYSITYVLNGGTINGEYATTYTHTVGAPLPANVTREGYTFRGWSVSADDFVKVTAIAGGATGHKTYYAWWTANSYTVTFNAAGGAAVEAITVTFDAAYGELPVPTRVGHTFLGWMLDGAEVTSETVVATAKDHTLTAKWEANVYNITYVLNGGKIYDPVPTFTYGVGAKLPKQVVLYGYTFEGWYRNPYGAGYSMKVIPADTVGDQVVYAKWTPIAGGAAPAPQAPCTGGSTCPMYPFNDLNTALWYHDGIHFALENGLMNGVGEGAFAPNAATSRAMIVTILWRLEGEPAVSHNMTFADVAAGKWYTEAVRWAASEGIVEGYSDVKFGPHDVITREQLATILWRYAKSKGYDVSVGENTNILSYGDAFTVSEWAIPAMQWACGAGLIQGIASGSGMNLAHSAGATRAQVAAILQRFCEYYN